MTQQLWCMLFQVHTENTMTTVVVKEFNTTYSVEVAACTQAGSGMVSPRVWLFVPEDSKPLCCFMSSCHVLWAVIFRNCIVPYYNNMLTFVNRWGHNIVAYMYIGVSTEWTFKLVNGHLHVKM